MPNQTYEENLDYLKKATEKWDAEHKDLYSLSALHKKGQECYAKIAAKRIETARAKEATVSSAKKSRLYSDEGIAELCKKLETKFTEEAATVQGAFKESVKKVLAYKRANLDKMLSTAPTQEQLNLLSALQIRKSSLSPGEVNKIAASLSGNYNALSALRTIAKSSGIDISIPAGLDYEALSRSLEWAEKYLNERCEDISKEWGKMTPFGRLFFGTEWNDNLFEDNAVSVLDNAAQMSVEVVPATRVITTTEKEMIDNLFKGVSETDLADKVKAAANESKAVEGLIRLHPDYRGFLENGDA